jgi:hypothetical protein
MNIINSYNYKTDAYLSNKNSFKSGKNFSGFNLSVIPNFNNIKPDSFISSIATNEKAWLIKQNNLKIIQAELETLQKQLNWNIERKWAEDFYAANKETIMEKLIKNNMLLNVPIKWGKKPEILHIDELIKPYDQELGELYHGTNPESHKKIMENGFNIDKCHSLDSVRGVYLTQDKTAAKEYGEKVITTEFKGQVASINTEILGNIKRDRKNVDFVKSLFTKDNPYPATTDSTLISYDILECFLRDLIQGKGYSGIMSSIYSWSAGCKYFVAIDPGKLVLKT